MSGVKSPFKNDPMWSYTEEVKVVEPKTTTLTLVNDYGTYSIKIKESDMALEDMMQNLVVPILISAGYDKQYLKEMLDAMP